MAPGWKGGSPSHAWSPDGTGGRTACAVVVVVGEEVDGDVVSDPASPPSPHATATSATAASARSGGRGARRHGMIGPSCHYRRPVAGTGLFVDITPLRVSRDYRLLFTGQMVSWLGRQLTIVAVPIQVYDLTGSSFSVGLVGAAGLVPLVVLSLLGGSIADAVDRRKLLLVTQVLLAASSVGLALNAQRDSPALWPIYVLSAATAGLSGVDLPARNAMLPRLVGRDLFASAAALGQLVFQVGGVAGPALAGVLISRVNLAAAYWVDVATFAVAAALVVRMRPQPPEGGGRRAGLASVLEGLRYLRGRRVLVSTFVIDLNAMVFGMPRALFPALGTGLFGGGATTVGLLFAAPGAGAFLAALFAGWAGRVRRQGLAVIVAVAVWGAAIALFGLVPWLPLALLLLAVAGAADVVSAVFRNTILQLSVPDSLRGRLSAVHIAVVTSGPRLGDVEAGTVAALTSPQVSVVSGGVACMLGVLAVHAWAPGLAAYRQDPSTGDPSKDVAPVDSDP
jgi:MFS family permease